MNIKKRTRLILVIHFFSIQLFAQQVDKRVFRDFFTPLTGQWECTVQTRDDTLHHVDWRDTQLRQFQWKLAKDMFEELALFPNKDTMIAQGLHIMSYDAKTKTFYQSGYWANKAGRTFDIEGKFSTEGRTINGIMIMYKENGKSEKHRVEIKWTDSNQFDYRVFKKDKKGIEFVLEELIYKRKK